MSSYAHSNSKNTILKVTMDYISSNWRDLLLEQCSGDFDVFWSLILPPVEKPNTTRTGWSQSSICMLPMPNGQTQNFIVKRQQNYNSATLFHPWKGIPTLEKEFQNIRLYRQSKLPTVEPVYFARRKCDCGDRASRLP